MKRLRLFISFLLVPLFIFAEPPIEAIQYHQGNFASLKARAAKEGKRCFVEFYTDYCGVCTRLEKKTFANPQIISYVKDNFIPYRVDGLSLLDEGLELAQKYHVRAYPTILVLDEEGRLLKTLEGFFTPAVLLTELTNLTNPSTLALFDTDEISRNAQRGRILKTIRPESAPRETRNVNSLFVDQYGLEVREFPSYGEAQDFVRVWDVAWDGGIWIIPIGFGRHKMVLGPIDSKEEAAFAIEKLWQNNGIQCKLLDLAKVF
jgi:thioredoxin-related protein